LVHAGCCSEPWPRRLTNGGSSSKHLDGLNGRDRFDPDRLPFDPDHVEPFAADQRAGLLRPLSRAARELLSSARVGPALQPRSPLETE
jgi:hypothetical protein